jgi:translation initiation factor IF-2
LSKGIRVNQLAKELGVESKDILKKCRDEGLGDKVTNHMSVLSLGLSETVREWFSGEGGGTAVQTAPAVDVATKPKLARRPTKKKSDTDNGEERPAGGEESSGEEAETTETSVDPAVEPAPVIAAPPAEAAPAAPAVSIAAPQPVQPVFAPPVQQAPAVAPVVRAPAMPAAGGSGVAAAAEAPLRPTVSIPAAPMVRPPVGLAGTGSAGGMSGGPGDVRPLRPTVSLSSRPAVGPAAERAAAPPPKLLVPKPATMEGPRIVREEAPEHLPAPRPRGPRPPGGGASDSPSFVQARARGGSGVIRVDDEEEEKKKAAAAKKQSLSTRRRGLDGRRGEATEKLREFTEADLIARRDALNAAAASRATVDRHLKQVAGRGQHAIAKTTVQKGEPVEIEEPVTVRTLAAALGVKAGDIVSKFMRKGIILANVNQALEITAAEEIALGYGIELQVKKEKTLDDVLTEEFALREVDAADLKPRPPVVTILGHVDHGKTSLLDKIRNANVAAGEAGGITQHTAAWMVTLGEGETAKRVTFIDTPGHQAFTSMRARGANMTDVVVLVVSAAEGVQPQTIESINHAKAAGVPIVVALNKIDRADANPDMVLGQLASNGLTPVEWGGDTEVVRTSATTGQGIPDLIEILDYQSQLLDLKADPTAPARGTVIESNMDEGLGSIATVLIQDGTLRPGDVVLSGAGYGRVRSLMNDRGETIAEATPSTPVLVSGLSVLPSAGDKLYQLDDVDRAREIAEERAMQSRQSQLAGQNRVTLENLFDTMKAGDVKTINLIIKGDVQGSVETLAKTVTDQNTDEVKVRVIHSAVGGINESDVELADASSAVIIGFHVVPDEAARAMAEQRRVEIRLYRVIYEIFDDLKKALSGMLEPEIREKLHGHAEIRQVFKFSKVGNIAGCFVTDGHIQRGSKVRLTRNGVIVVEDLSIETLKRLKDDVKEVKAGFECGIKVAGYDDIKVGDIMEAYIKETIQRTL